MTQTVAHLDRRALDEALLEANIPSLLAVLFQLTGDDRWLRDPYRPLRPRGMDANDGGGLSTEIQQEIRAAAAEAVSEWADGRAPVVPAPDPVQLQALMDLCMGEPVDPAYEPMMAQEMDFRPAPVRRTNRDTSDFSVVIIGAGVSGALAALKLREAGIASIIIEKNDEVGGSWLENKYPGAGVDTPSFLYQYSFFDHDWSTHFGKRDEVEQYLIDMVDHFDLRSSIRFGTEVTEAAYDKQTQLWTVRTRDAAGKLEELTANAVITAVGQLNRPKLPPIPGLDTFTGPIFHSARWPEGLDLTGKRLAVIGTGASAMQIVPAVVDTVASATIFQRSAQWIAPSEVYYTPVPDGVHWLMAHLPFYRAWYRFRLNLTFNDKVHPSLQIDPDWEFPERSVNAANDGHRRFFTRYLLDQLAGREDLQAKALPTYPPFGKRMLLDNGWYAALKRPNVELVTEAATEVTATGVLTADGTAYDADVIVLATGFQTTKILWPMQVRGNGGESIRDAWGEDDASAYLGITTPSFPNLFITCGPQTVLGHGGSFITTAECQVRYIVDLISTMIEDGIGAVECRPDVNSEYNARVDAAHDDMIWSHRGMTNWYRNPAGRVVSSTPWRIVDYWHMTKSADLADFTTYPAV